MENHTTLYKITLLPFEMKVSLCGVLSVGAVQIGRPISSVFLENSSRFFILTHCNHRPQSAMFQQSDYSFSEKKVSRFLKR